MLRTIISVLTGLGFLCRRPERRGLHQHKALLFPDDKSELLALHTVAQEAPTWASLRTLEGMHGLRPQPRLTERKSALGQDRAGSRVVLSAHKPSESSDVSGCDTGLMVKSQQAVVLSLADQEERVWFSKVRKTR